MEIWWLKFNWLLNVTPRTFSNLVLEILFSLIIASKFSFLLKSKYIRIAYRYIVYRDSLSCRYFQTIQIQVLKISQIKLLLPLDFSLCNMVCYRSLCHYKKETSHKNILNESSPSIDLCGTPTTIFHHEMNWSFILTFCVRPVK